MKLAPAKKRLLVYASIIGACAVLAISFFTASQFSRAKYVASKAQLEGASKELIKLDEEEVKVNENTSLSEVEKTVELRVIGDKRTWYSGIKEYFDKENTKNAKSYKALSIPAYTFSLLALVSFGFCLKFEDKAKEKEENDQ